MPHRAFRASSSSPLRAVVLALLAGCSTSHVDPVPLDDLGTTYATVFCGALADCYGSTVSSLILGSNTCADTFNSTFRDQTLPLYRAAIDAGTLIYDGTTADDCEAALELRGCDIFNTRLPDECETTLIGTLGLGAACTLDEECMGETFCDHAGAACPGTCQTRAASGAACMDDAGCRSGLQCAGGLCRAPGGVGATCEGMTNVRCGPETICLGADADMARSGTCRGIDETFSGAMGASCDPTGGPLCAEGLSCTLVEVVGMMPVFSCGARAASGGACRVALPDACPPDQFCNDIDPMRLDFDGTCAPLPGAGEPCAGLPARCAVDSRCVEGMCLGVGDLGAPCETGENCWSGTCVGGVCEAPMLCAG